jgi:hypothetical protein
MGRHVTSGSVDARRQGGFDSMVGRLIRLIAGVKSMIFS